MPLSRDSEVRAVERFWQKVSRSDGCWEWTGAVKPNGYGVVRIGGELKHAHRVSYELTFGEIPDGLVIDHLCRNRKCVNPNHLEPVTKRENAIRGIPGIPVTHCKQGHPLTDDNVYRLKSGGRICRRCQIARSAATYMRNKA